VTEVLARLSGRSDKLPAVAYHVNTVARAGAKYAFWVATERGTAMLTIEGVTHWSIPVRNLEEGEEFYTRLGLEPLGRLATSRQACFRAGDACFLICETGEMTPENTGRSTVHYSFTVSASTWDEAIPLVHELNIPIDHLSYRAEGFFLGRELYIRDPSGNFVELRDPTWKQGMPTPTVDEILAVQV